MHLLTLPIFFYYLERDFQGENNKVRRDMNLTLYVSKQAGVRFFNVVFAMQYFFIFFNKPIWDQASSKKSWDPATWKIHFSD